MSAAPVLAEATTTARPDCCNGPLWQPRTAASNREGPSCTLKSIAMLEPRPHAPGTAPCLWVHTTGSLRQASRGGSAMRMRMRTLPSRAPPLFTQGQMCTEVWAPPAFSPSALAGCFPSKVLYFKPFLQLLFELTHLLTDRPAFIPASPQAFPHKEPMHH